MKIIFTHSVYSKSFYTGARGEAALHKIFKKSGKRSEKSEKPKINVRTMPHHTEFEIGTLEEVASVLTT